VASRGRRYYLKRTGGFAPHTDHAVVPAAYDAAIALNPGVAAYYSNRAITHVRLENYGYAVADANKALAVDKTFVKAYYRRATAHMGLLKFKEALRDLRTLVKVRA